MQNRRKIRRWLCGLAVTIGLVLLAVGAAICYPQELLSADSGPAKADTIVVLGGGWKERSKRAAELFQEQAAPQVLVTGWGDCEKSRKLLVEAGVPAQTIQMECESHTTRENAQFTVKLLREQKARRVIIVTTWYHSRRALACFRHYGPDMEFYSRPSYYAYLRAEWSQKGISRYVHAEYVKLLGYWIRYGVCPI